MTLEKRVDEISELIKKASENTKNHLEDFNNRLAALERGRINTANMFAIHDRRIEALEGGKSRTCQKQDKMPKTIELEIEWPEADIGGLHFNSQKTRGIFDLKEDGNYYSRDIMFHSARDTDDGTGRDLLSEYLDSLAVQTAFFAAIGNSIAQDYTIRVFLPEDNQGIKKYNGVSWWYWLRDRSSGSAACFCYVDCDGNTNNGSAGGVGGCAPAFCVEVIQ